MPITDAQRDDFDGLLEQVLETLPEQWLEHLREVPLIVEDYPSAAVLREMDLDPRRDRLTLCGLHWGTPLTQRSVEMNPEMPDHLMIFREPILSLAGRSRRELLHQIRVTVLHEMGHHFGLDEDDLEALGYG